MCTAIQRKGCLVVRLLSSAEHLTSQPVCVSLASAVVGALAQWRTEPEVEVEVSSPLVMSATLYPLFLPPLCRHWFVYTSSVILQNIWLEL